MNEKQIDWGTARISGPAGLDHLFGKPLPDEAHISLYVPTVPGDSMIEVRRQLIDLTLQAERLLAKSWAQEDLEDLLHPVYERIKMIQLSPGVRGVALFRISGNYYMCSIRSLIKSKIN